MLPKPNDKVFIRRGNKYIPGTVRSVYPKTKEHSGSFWVDIHEGRWENTARFTEYDYGRSVVKDKE